MMNRDSTFSTTHWTVVIEAGRADSPESQGALEQLCATYWYPLYAFVRRKGHSPEDSQDLTQEFFARLLEKQYLSLADQSRGKFRTFLLRSLEHFLINKWAKSHAAKRNHQPPVLSLDAEQIENRYRADQLDVEAPDQVFEKRWALTLLDSVMGRLREELAGEKQQLFDALQSCLWGERTDVPLAEIGAKLGLSEGAVKVAAHRLRQRFREMLRTEVARTVATTAEVDEELQYLAAVLRR